MSAPRPNRIRIRFDKWGPIRFTSHRDVARVWERTLRRCQVPVAYSEGFSPRPRLRFGLALATAYESCGEYLDVDLEQEVVIDDRVLGPITDALPQGMHALGLADVAPGTPSLQEAVDSCDWLVELPEVGSQQADAIVEQVLTAPELQVTRERKGKVVTDDIRPAVLALEVVSAASIPIAAAWQPSGALLRVELATRPRACRPSELVAALGGEIDEGRVIRLHQWTKVGDDRIEPLPIGSEQLAGCEPRRAGSPTASATRQAS